MFFYIYSWLWVDEKCCINSAFIAHTAIYTLIPRPDWNQKIKTKMPNHSHRFISRDEGWPGLAFILSPNPNSNCFESQLEFTKRQSQQGNMFKSEVLWADPHPTLEHVKLHCSQEALTVFKSGQNLASCCLFKGLSLSRVMMLNSAINLKGMEHPHSCVTRLELLLWQVGEELLKS